MGEHGVRKMEKEEALEKNSSRAIEKEKRIVTPTKKEGQKATATATKCAVNEYPESILTSLP